MKMGNVDEREVRKLGGVGGKRRKKVLHSHLIAVRMYGPGRSSERNAPLDCFCCLIYALRGPGNHWDISLHVFTIFVCSF